MSYKQSHVNNDPWAVMIALASLIIVATVAAIAVLCILWNNYTNRRISYEQSLMTQMKQSEPVSQPQYEVQGLDMFVPNEDGEDLGEVHVEFSPREGIQSIQHVSQRPSNQSAKSKDTSLYQRVIHYSKLGQPFHQQKRFKT